MSRRATYLLLALIILTSVLFSRTFARSIFQQSSHKTLVSGARSSKALAITDDAALLIVVNPDSNSVSIVDTAGQEVLAELGVGVDPRTVTVDQAGKWAYVANHGSDTISIVDLSGRQVSGEIAVGNGPYGVVLSPDDRYLYVAEQGRDSLAILETKTGRLIRRIALADRPSGLAIGGEGQLLYVTHLLSNAVTVVDVSRPYTIQLPILSLSSLVEQSKPIQEQSATGNQLLTNLSSTLNEGRQQDRILS